MKKLTMLMILDGFGIAPANDYNAITVEGIPNIRKLIDNYPHAKLGA